MNNYPNDPYSQPTTAGSYPQWHQQPPAPPTYPQNGQIFPPNGPNSPQKEWYQKPGGIILMLIFFFPVGLYLMWKYATWPKGVKWGITGVIAFCMLCSGIANATGPTQQSTTQVAVPTAQPSPSHHAILATVQALVPTPVPTPIPTPVPTQPPVSQPAQLTVTFTLENVTDYADSYISVHTLPNAALNITVTYCSGRNANSDSLKGTQYADIAGDYMWDWTPETTCRGNGTAYVTASLNGQTASNSTSFTVS